jgi:hypothetical protein
VTCARDGLPRPQRVPATPPDLGRTGVVFSGLSSLVIRDVAGQDGVMVVPGADSGGPVPCLGATA